MHTDPTTHLLEQVTALLGEMTLERNELRQKLHALQLDFDAFTGSDAMSIPGTERMTIDLGRGKALMEYRPGGDNEWGNYEEPQPVRVFLNGNWHDIDEVVGSLDAEVLRDAIDAETGDYYDTKSLNAEFVADGMSELRRAA